MWKNFSIWISPKETFWKNIWNKKFHRLHSLKIYLKWKWKEKILRGACKPSTWGAIVQHSWTPSNHSARLLCCSYLDSFKVVSWKLFLCFTNYIRQQSIIETFIAVNYSSGVGFHKNSPRPQASTSLNWGSSVRTTFKSFRIELELIKQINFSTVLVALRLLLEH